MKRVKELINPLVGGLTGAVNTDVMTEVEKQTHGRLWQVCHDLLMNLFRAIFQHHV